MRWRKYEVQRNTYWHKAKKGVRTSYVLVNQYRTAGLACNESFRLFFATLSDFEAIMENCNAA